MEMEKIYWKTVIEKIEKGENIKDIKVDFNNETILWSSAMLLAKNGIEVPQELIDYDDENIDYSDIPPITDEELQNGKIKRVINVELSLEQEIVEWIKNEDVNINELATKLVFDFYKTKTEFDKR